MQPLRAFGVLASLLAGMIALELASVAEEDEPAAPAEAITLPPPLPPRAERSAAWAEAALARPLFNEDRRPPSPPAPSLAAKPRLPRLTGTLLGPFGRRALMVDGNGDKAIALGESDQVGVWRVEAISAGAVTLSSSEGTWSIQVSYKEAPQAGTSVQVSGPAPRIRRHGRK